MDASSNVFHLYTSSHSVLDIISELEKLGNSNTAPQISEAN